MTIFEFLLLALATVLAFIPSPLTMAAAIAIYVGLLLATETGRRQAQGRSTSRARNEMKHLNRLSAIPLFFPSKIISISILFCPRIFRASSKNISNNAKRPVSRSAPDSRQRQRRAAQYRARAVGETSQRRFISRRAARSRQLGRDDSDSENLRLPSCLQRGPDERT